jgi:hypothetical protein
LILSLTQSYRYTPEIFLFSTAIFKYIYRAQWNGYHHFRFALDFSYAFGIL